MHRKIDIATVGGLVLGVVAIFGGFTLEGGDFGALLMLPAMVTVFVGTIAATIIGTSMANIKVLGHLFGLVIAPPSYDAKSAIDEITRFSSISRRSGLLTLDSELHNVRDDFMRRILRNAIDGAEPDVLQEVANSELESMADRHAYGASLFQKMGGYSPTMGIIGTVMGLINTLAAAGDSPDTLIRHIASAFIATLWGVFMANIVWLPIAEKLRHIHGEENLYKEIIVEGVLAIQAGEIPSVAKAKLMSKLPPQMQEAV
jgi:chemotaxis protein MotA